jgi:hypothetical protein
MRTAIAMTNLSTKNKTLKNLPHFPSLRLKHPHPKNKPSQTQNAHNNPDLEKEHKHTNKCARRRGKKTTKVQKP